VYASVVEALGGPGVKWPSSWGRISDSTYCAVAPSTWSMARRGLDLWTSPSNTHIFGIAASVTGSGHTAVAYRPVAASEILKLVPAAADLDLIASSSANRALESR
jgi:hypothetical protein